MTATVPSLHLVERAAQQLRQRGLPGMPGAVPLEAPAAVEPVRAEAERALGPFPEFQAETARGGEKLTARQLERGGMIGDMTERNRVWEEFRIVQSQLTRNPPACAGTAYSGANLCLVTSALAGEGKTFCSINLSASIALYSARKVLLVDVDSKRNSLTRALGIAQDGFGLWNLVANPGADPTRAIIATELPNLFFVPIGAHQEAESLPIAPAVRELGRHFLEYFLILDAAPCLCSSTPSTLAEQVGQIVLVVEAERTQRREIEAALDLIEACPNVRLMLNKIQSTASSTFGTHHHGYHEAARNS